VRDTIQGYKLEFAQVPPETSIDQPALDKENSAAVESSIESMQKLNAIRKCEYTAGQFVSPVFVVPKSDGSKRFILNLKKLNKFIKHHHFKLEDTRTARTIIDPNSFLAPKLYRKIFIYIPQRDLHLNVYYSAIN